MVLNAQHITRVSMNTELVRERISHLDLRRVNDYVPTTCDPDQQSRDAAEHQPEEADDERAPIDDSSRSERSDYTKCPHRHLEPYHHQVPRLKQSATACVLSTR